MLIPPKALSTDTLDRETLARDLKAALRCGSCALGKRALYLGGYLFSNTRYIPLTRVERVFKRLAVSKGYYEGKVFGSIAYLVVRYDGGREKVYRFDREEELDALLNAFRKNTRIPVGKP